MNPIEFRLTGQIGELEEEPLRSCAPARLLVEDDFARRWVACGRSSTRRCAELDGRIFPATRLFGGRMDLGPAALGDIADGILSTGIVLA